MSKTDVKDDQLLTVPQAAELLQLAPGTVYHLAAQRKLPTVRLSARCLRFSRRALLKWIEGLAQPADHHQY